MAEARLALGEIRSRASTLYAQVMRMALIAPFAGATAYLLVLAANYRSILVGVFWNSDVASIPLIAGDVAHHAGGVARVSFASYYSTFMFDLLTKGLPFHRGLWEFLSIGLSLAGVVLMAWASRRAAGKAAGILTFSIGIAVSPLLLYTYFAFRGPTWFAGMLLGASLVFLATLPEQTPRWLVAAGVLAVGFIAGSGVASDPLVAAAGVLPFLGAALAAWLLLPGKASARVAKTALVLVGVAVASALFTYRFMPTLGFKIVLTQKVQVVAASRILPNLKMYAEDILAFGNEEYPSTPHGVVSLPGLVVLLLALGALASPARLIPALRRRRDQPTKPVSLALALHLFFWLSTALIVSAAFVFSNLPTNGIATARYLPPVFFAIAGCVGVWVADLSWTRIVAAATAAVFCVLSMIGVVQFVPLLRAYPLSQAGPRLISYLQAHGLTKGYGGYFDALGLTWRSDSAVRVVPAVECGIRPARALCQMGVNTITSWYDAVPGRSFVVIGPSYELIGLFDPPPPELGPPAEVDKVEIFTVYVYNYDVGTRLHPALKATP